MIKLTAIVALDGLDSGSKLRVRIGEKIGQNSKSLGFEAKREGLSVVGAVIKDDKIVLVARYTDNRRCPKITMY